MPKRQTQAKAEPSKAEPPPPSARELRKSLRNAPKTLQNETSETPQPELKTEVKTEFETEVKTEVKTEFKTEFKTELKTEFKTEEACNDIAAEMSAYEQEREENIRRNRERMLALNLTSLASEVEFGGGAAVRQREARGLNAGKERGSNKRSKPEPGSVVVRRSLRVQVRPLPMSRSDVPRMYKM
jgi:hypothetical protein